ncbi:MAG: FAD-dependent oxidoreductase [Thermoleophilia bacterium]|nr:FAD-dependent oxidoreductase [Thermoleophilia bacterium]
MADRKVDYLLVGGGLASAQCAAELRRRGADGSILLVGREPDPPYDRPPLSKEYLRGEHGRERAYVHETDWYAENDVELLTAKSVMSLDVEARTAKLQGKQEVGFDKALIATGAMVNILRVDGAQLDGIHYLRAFGNSDAIREDLSGVEHVVLIGGSYIGAEVAASLVQLGKRCTIVMLEEVLLSRVFGDEAGRYFHDLLESKGVEIVGGEELAAFVGADRVSGVRTKDGREIGAEAVVVGAGVKPDVMLAQRAGLEVDDGVLVDAGLETSVGGIFAAGDCARYESERFGGSLRIEHWDVAFQQGRHAARGMIGEKSPYEVIPYFFSDLADWASLEYVGHATQWDRVIFRGDREAGEFSAWYLDQGVVEAALSVGRSEDLQEARRLIESCEKLENPDALADADSDLSAIGVCR